MKDSLENYWFIKDVHQGPSWGRISKKVGSDHYLVKYGMDYMNPEGGGDRFHLVSLARMEDWDFFPNEKEYNKACDLIAAKRDRLKQRLSQRRTA